MSGILQSWVSSVQYLKQSNLFYYFTFQVLFSKIPLFDDSVYFYMLEQWLLSHFVQDFKYMIFR